MLVGTPPYFCNNRDQLFHNIERGVLKLPSILSNESKDLLKNLLQRNPSRRLGSGINDVEEIKKHPFFNGINWNDVYLKKLKPPLPPKRVGRPCITPVDLGDKYKKEENTKALN